MDWLTPEAYWSVTAPVTAGSLQRSRDTLERILDQFQVETAQRYKRDAQGRTQCDTYVADVTRALGCGLPAAELERVPRCPTLAARLRLLACPDPLALADIIREAEEHVARYVELDAGATVRWLAGQHGKRHGWVEVDQALARHAADGGCPVVVGWENPGGIGHLAIGTPAPLGTPQDGLLWVASAGRENHRRCLVRGSFGNAPVRYFTHQ